MKTGSADTYAELLHAAHFAQHYTFLTPAQELSAYVECYWLLDLRDARFAAVHFQDFIFATLHTSLVLNLGSPFEVRGLPGLPSLSCPQSICVGQQPRPLTYRHTHGNFLVGIKFRPAAFHCTFGVRATELSAGLVPAEAMLRDIAQLEERVHKAASLAAVQQELDALLYRAWHKPPDVRLQAVHRACRPALLAQSRYRLGELAASLCLTPRTLERYFADALGLSPKTCLRIARFRQALPAYVRLGYRADYETLGYHDFSHFMKDYHCFGQSA